MNKKINYRKFYRKYGFLIHFFIFIIFLIVILFIYYKSLEKEPLEILEESIGSGFLVVETLPSDADIFIDNIFSGKSPLKLNNIIAGSHNIVIKKDNYEEYISEFTIEAGKKTLIEASLVLLPIIVEEVEMLQDLEEELEEETKPTLKLNGVVNIGEKFVLYYDFSEGKFTENRQLDSDIFSKRFDAYIVFTRFDPINIKIIDKKIDDVKKEDCEDLRGQYELLYSEQTLCISTKEGETAAIGGKWDQTENAKLKWKLFN